MPPARSKLSDALREWIEVFIHRSMCDTMQFRKETGLSMPQIGTLMKLHFRGACGVSDVGSYLGVTDAAASQMVERLVQLKILERTEDSNDRRVKQLTLTARGRSLVEKNLGARRRWLEALVSTLSPDEQADISQALARLTRAARELEAAEPVGSTGQERS